MITKQSNMVSVLKEMYSDDARGSLVYSHNPFMSLGAKRGVSMRRMFEALRHNVESSKLSRSLTARLETKATPEGLLGEIGAKVVMDLEAAAK